MSFSHESANSNVTDSFNVKEKTASQKSMAKHKNWNTHSLVTVLKKVEFTEDYDAKNKTTEQI